MKALETLLLGITLGKRQFVGIVPRMTPNTLLLTQTKLHLSIYHMLVRGHNLVTQMVLLAHRVLQALDLGTTRENNQYKGLCGVNEVKISPFGR
jgi:hypothetical protein